jgi:hypothetical protein
MKHAGKLILMTFMLAFNVQAQILTVQEMEKMEFMDILERGVDTQQAVAECGDNKKSLFTEDKFKQVIIGYDTLFVSKQGMSAQLSSLNESLRISCYNDNPQIIMETQKLKEEGMIGRTVFEVGVSKSFCNKYLAYAKTLPEEKLKRRSGLDLKVCLVIQSYDGTLSERVTDVYTNHDGSVRREYKEVESGHLKGLFMANDCENPVMEEASHFWVADH